MIFVEGERIEDSLKTCGYSIEKTRLRKGVDKAGRIRKVYDSLNSKRSCFSVFNPSHKVHKRLESLQVSAVTVFRIVPHKT